MKVITLAEDQQISRPKGRWFADCITRTHKSQQRESEERSRSRERSHRSNVRRYREDYNNLWGWIYRCFIIVPAAIFDSVKWCKVRVYLCQNCRKRLVHTIADGIKQKVFYEGRRRTCLSENRHLNHDQIRSAFSPSGPIGRGGDHYTLWRP